MPETSLEKMIELRPVLKANAMRTDDNHKTISRRLLEPFRDPLIIVPLSKRQEKEVRDPKAW